MYRRVHDAIEALGQKAAAAPFSVAGVLDANDELVNALRTAAHTGAGISRIRFAKNVVNGRFIEDALLYRVA